jgi:hypothetical protein
MRGSRQLPEAIRRPSGLNATHETTSVGTLREWVSRTVPASQIVTVLSQMESASRLLSGLNARLEFAPNSGVEIAPVCALRVRLSRGHAV